MPNLQPQVAHSPQRLELDISGAADDSMLVSMWLSGRPENTRRAYSKDVERFRCYVTKPLQHITARDLIDYAESLARLATSTQHRKLSSVKSLFSYAHKLGYIRLDPAAALRLPKPSDNRAGKLIPPEAVQAIARAVTGRDRLIVRTLYLLGLREAELIALRAEDIRETATGYAVAITGKGGKLRHLACPAGLARDLRAYRGSGPIFPVDASTVYRVIRSAGEAAGYRISPHGLRHAHASHALDSGATLPLVRDSLGHASIATTSVYLHCKPSDGSAMHLSDYADQEHGPK